MAPAPSDECPRMTRWRGCGPSWLRRFRKPYDAILGAALVADPGLDVRDRRAHSVRRVPGTWRVALGGAMDCARLATRPPCTGADSVACVAVAPGGPGFGPGARR